MIDRNKEVKEKTVPNTTDFAIYYDGSTDQGLKIYHCTEDSYQQVTDILRELDCSSQRTIRDSFLDLLSKYSIIEEVKKVSNDYVFGLDC